MQDKISNILKDLYGLDPEFQKHEQRLKVLLEQLLEQKPDIHIDAAFAMELKRKLLAKASMLESEYFQGLEKRFSFMKKLNFALAALVFVVGAAFGGFYYTRQGTEKNMAGQQLFSSNVALNNLSDNAFGRLITKEARTGGGGNEAGGLALAGTDAGSEKAGDFSGKMSMPVMPITQYTYVYKGEEIKIQEQPMDVLRRVKGISGSTNAASIFKQLNLGVLNPASFPGAKLSSLTVNQDQKYGYSITVNLDEGAVYINQNWEQWDMPESSCRDEACVLATRLKFSDMPGNEEIIAIGDKFLKDHNISRSAYGEPFVQEGWSEQYAYTEEKSIMYAPDVVNVIYPLVIDGAAVYDESGNKTGLMVTVNLRFKKVASVGELTSNRFEASRYETETNVERLLKLAEQGGWRNGFGYPMPLAKNETASPRLETVELGTPENSYVKIWQYKEGKNNELLVPALVFPIVKKPVGGYFYQTSVVVPLIKEILDEQALGGPVRIMEDIQPAVK